MFEAGMVKSPTMIMVVRAVERESVLAKTRMPSVGFAILKEVE